MLLAREARRDETIRCREKILENEIQYVENTISKAVNEGKFSVEVPVYLSTNTVDELKRLNYSVLREFRAIDFSDSNGFTKISWD